MAGIKTHINVAVTDDLYFLAAKNDSEFARRLNQFSYQ